MIPAQNIVAWGNLVPWTDARQIEQDLIISRALVEIFSVNLGEDGDDEAEVRHHVVRARRGSLRLAVRGILAHRS